MGFAGWRPPCVRMVTAMRDSDSLRKIASDLRVEAGLRDAHRKAQSVRIVTAAAGITALRKLAGGRS